MKRFYVEIKKYWGYALYAAKSDLHAEVANSYLNWLWWVLEPTSSMIIYTLVFGTVFKTDELYFPIFVFIGVTIWDYFSKCITSSVDLIRNNQHIISKVYMPKYILLIQRMLVLLFKMMISWGLIVILMTLYDVPIGINILYIFFIMVDFLLLTFSLSLFLLHFGVYVSDLSNLINIALNLTFYVTGIFYNISKSFPMPFGYVLQRINPVAYIIFCLRKVLLHNETPSVIMLIIWLIIAGILSIVGIKLVYKNENNYAKMI